MLNISHGRNLKPFCLAVLIVASITTNANKSFSQEQASAQNLISLSSEKGEQLLFTSQARRDYVPLSLEFVTQDNLAFCGVATMVMVLNALEVDAPASKRHTIPGFVSYKFFNQKNIFNNQNTQAVIRPEVVARQGMTLTELAGLFQSYPVQATMFHGAEMSLEQFRNLAIQNLKEADNFIVINYLRSALGQPGGGHISPIAAYHQDSDRFLILDVARYRYAPVWVEAKALWQAINTMDSTSGKTRGVVLVQALDPGK